MIGQISARCRSATSFEPVCDQRASWNLALTGHSPGVVPSCQYRVTLYSARSHHCVQQLYTMNCTHIWTDLTVLWIGFCLIGPISLCLDSFLCMYYFVWLYIACMCSIATWWKKWAWWDWSLSLGPLLPSVLWHCWLGHLTHKNPSPIWPIA